jgi:hypothetical protein
MAGSMSCGLMNCNSERIARPNLSQSIGILSGLQGDSNDNSRMDFSGIEGNE